VCARAVAAARQAEADIAALIPIRPDPEGRAARFGLALHIGQVLYGNVGGGRRLDFTCIGPAVNLASRLERIAGRLDRTIVASAQFAARLPGAFTALGVFDLPGFAEPQAAFALAR
jgi:adenylate cyclase